MTATSLLPRLCQSCNDWHPALTTCAGGWAPWDGQTLVLSKVAEKDLDYRKRAAWSRSKEAWKETAEDRERQRTIAARAGAAWGVTMTERPEAHLWDFDARQGQTLVALVEVKSRAIRWGDYPDIILSKRYKVARLMKQTTPSIVLVHTRLDDRLHFVRLTPQLVATLVLDTGGEAPRPGTDHDRELVYHLPLAIFDEIA